MDGKMPALAVRVSPAAQRTIREAFAALERTISPEDSSDFAGMTLENVVRAAHEVEDQLAARQSLRNMRRLMPLFTGLEYYSKSIEVLCNGTPYLPWIWAPIKLILQIASDFVDAFDRIIRAYARIAEPLTRFNIFNQTYSKSLEFQYAIAIFYSDILKFHEEAYKFVRRSSWKVLFRTSWGRFQRRFDNIIDDLKAHENLVDKTASAVGLSEARKMREDLETLRQESFDKISREEEERMGTQYFSIVGWLKMDDSEQLKIFDSIAAEAKKYPGTCEWILKQNKIAAWMRCSHESSFIILHGHPGTGKSVMLTEIATFLMSSGQSLVISHICTYLQTASIEYDKILRSILLQLVRSNTDLVAYIFEEFILAKKPVTVQAIERLILTVIGTISNTPANTNYVHIILDGLDECSKEKQSRIINLLERMVSTALASTSTICKVIVSTHMPPAVAKTAKQKQVVSLSKEKASLEKAITNYTAQRLHTLRPRWFQMGMTDAELEELELRLAKKADGMFLWARLVIEYLSTNMFINKSEVIGAVDTLPRELSEFYGQIITRLIANFDKRSVIRMQSILNWIAFARRPLRKAELRSALSFVDDVTNINIQALAPNYLFDMCTPLIEERSDSTFAFIHVSVKEYLQSPESNIVLDKSSASYEQGLVSTACLLSGLQVFQPTYPEQVRFLRVLQGFHGLHVYATEYWVEYLLSVAASGSGLDVGSRFFSRSYELAMVLNKLPSKEVQCKEQTLLDHRLNYIEDHPELRKAAGAILLRQEAKTLGEASATDGTCPSDGSTMYYNCSLQGRADSLFEIIDLTTLLLNYQQTVKALLQLRSFSGVSVQELEKFKQDFRSTAFTCRLRSCPLASTGFDSEALRDDHELSHTPCIACEITSCQYPPFTSTRALKNHLIKYHGQGKPKIKIKTLQAEGASQVSAITRRGDSQYSRDASYSRPRRRSAPQWLYDLFNNNMPECSVFDRIKEEHKSRTGTQELHIHKLLLLERQQPAHFEPGHKYRSCVCEICSFHFLIETKCEISEQNCSQQAKLHSLLWVESGLDALITSTHEKYNPVIAGERFYCQTPRCAMVVTILISKPRLPQEFIQPLTGRDQVRQRLDAFKRENPRRYGTLELTGDFEYMSIRNLSTYLMDTIYGHRSAHHPPKKIAAMNKRFNVTLGHCLDLFRYIEFQELEMDGRWYWQLPVLDLPLGTLHYKHTEVGSKQAFIEDVLVEIQTLMPPEKRSVISKVPCFPADDYLQRDLGCFAVPQPPIPSPDNSSDSVIPSKLDISIDGP